MKSISALSLKKGGFFGSLYFTQTIPKGYLKVLPILMAEKGNSMLMISFVALLSSADLFKPIIGFLLDSPKFSSVKHQKNILVGIQGMIILLLFFSLFSPQSSDNHFQLLLIFSICNFLTIIHDTAVDGLAVKALVSEEERKIGGLSQYIGYKSGTLFTSGFLPSIFGANHNLLCLSIIGAMLLVMCSTIRFHLNISEDHSSTFQIPTSTLNQSIGQFPPKFDPKNIPFPNILLTLSLLFYKFADHGLDFIWSPLLIQSKVQKSTVLVSQFILGTFASLIGASFGGLVLNQIGDVTNTLMLLGIIRIVPNIMQLMFTTLKSTNSTFFISLHSIFENIFGSAISGIMFTFLLQSSDPNSPALSYALLNSLALIGMKLGEIFFSLFCHYTSFSNTFFLGIFVNILFPIFLYLFKRLNNQILFTNNKIKN